MIIGIDAREAAGQRAGKGEVVYQIIKELAKRELTDNFIIYSNEQLDLPTNAKIKYQIITSRGWHYFWQLRKKSKNNEFDLFFSPTSYLVPLFISKLVIIIVHDLAVYQPGMAHNFKAKLIEKLTLGWVTRKAKKIIAVSESTKADLIKIKKIPASKIEVIYNGIESAKKISTRQLRQFLAVKKITKSYILFVGTLEPRKNIVRLIEAYHKLSNELKNKHDLLIAGKKGWYYQEIFDVVKDKKLENKVKFLGYVPDSELPHYYAGCTVFAYPSLYEGFGFPVAQAMSYGKPALTSNISSLPEVADGGGILVDPTSVAAITKGLAELLQDQGKRESLAKKGQAHVAHFNWPDNVNRILEIINSK